MDPSYKFTDQPHTYTTGFGQQDSSLMNKSPSRTEFSSAINADYTQASHFDNRYTNQQAPDRFESNNVYLSQGLAPSLGQNLINYSEVSYGVNNQKDLSASGNYQTGIPSYQLSSNALDLKNSRAFETSHEDVKASLDSGLLARNAALRVLGGDVNVNTADNNNQQSQNRYAAEISSSGVYSAGKKLGDEALGSVKDYGLGQTSGYGHISSSYEIDSTRNRQLNHPVSQTQVEETKTNFGSRGTDQAEGIPPYMESSGRYLSPEARRILGSPIPNEQRSTTQGNSENKPWMQQSASTNPYLSTLANTAQTTMDPLRNRESQGISRLAEIGGTSLNTNALENIINDPVISKRTIYTIENNTPSKITSNPDTRSLHTPERVPKTRSPIRSPLDDLRHSLQNDNVRISKIVIETVENDIKPEVDSRFDVEGSRGNNRFDIVMEQSLSHRPNYQSISPFKSPATDRSYRRNNDQEPAFGEPSSLRKQFEDLKRDVASYTADIQTEAPVRQNYRNEESPSDVRYQTKSDRSDADFNINPNPVQQEVRAQQNLRSAAPQKEVPRQPEEKKAQDSKLEKAVKEEVKVIKDKKSQNLLVKGVVGLLVIILLSLLSLELFTDIKIENFYSS